MAAVTRFQLSHLLTMPKPLAKEYRIAVLDTNGDVVEERGDTNKRNAIRRARRSLREYMNHNPDKYLSAAVRAGAPFGPLLYQCHTDGNGVIIVDEL